VVATAGRSAITLSEHLILVLSKKRNNRSLIRRRVKGGEGTKGERGVGKEADCGNSSLFYREDRWGRTSFCLQEKDGSSRKIHRNPWEALLQGEEIVNIGKRYT